MKIITSHVEISWKIVFCILYIYIRVYSFQFRDSLRYNKRVSQMRVLLAARRETAGDQNRPPMVQYVFNIKLDMF